MEVQVLLTTFNRECLLREALHSVLAQTYTDFSLLVFDNGSTDHTRHTIEQAALSDERIRYLPVKVNMGSACNVRRAFLSATSDYIAWIMDDDLWAATHLESGLQFLQAHPDASVYSCCAQYLGGHADSVVPSYFSHHARTIEYNFSERYSEMLRGTPIIGSSIIVRRRSLETVSMWPLVPVIDWLLYGQLAFAGPFVYNPQALVRYRVHSQQDSRLALRGKKAAVQYRYALRILSTLALDRGILSPTRLVSDVIDSWEPGPASTLAVALASADSPKLLREAAVEIVKNHPTIRTSEFASRHCRAAFTVGMQYLTVADIADRIVSRWWSPFSA